MDPIQQNTTPQTPNTNYDDNFDPTKDIDISSIEDQIIDTSRGDKVDFQKTAYHQVYSFKCLNCGFKYEGRELLEKCPRCGSDKIDDSQ